MLVELEIPLIPQNRWRPHLGAVDMRNRLILGIVAAFAIAASSQQADARDRFKVGYWKGGAYFEGGRFSHCAMSVRYRSGITVFFSITRGYKFIIGFSKRGWNFTPGTKFRLQYLIDGYPIYSGTAQTNSRLRSLVTAYLPATRQVFDRFRRGYLFAIKTSKGRSSFSLAGSYAALTRLLNCTKYSIVAERGGSSARSTRPSSGAFGRQQATNSRRIQLRLEATTSVVNLLARAKITGYQILQPRAVPSAFRGYHVVWKMGSMLGAFAHIGPKPKRTIQVVISAFIAADEKSCRGKFRSGISRSGSKTIYQFSTGCDYNGPIFKDYYVWKSPSGKISLLGFLHKNQSGRPPQIGQVVQAIFPKQ